MANRTETDSLARLSTGDLRWRVLTGDAYYAAQSFVDVPNNDTKSLLIDNTDDSTHIAVANTIVRSEGKVVYQKAFNVTEDTQGAVAGEGIMNKRSKNGGTPVGTVRTGGDGETGVYTGGGRLSKGFVGSNGNRVSRTPGDLNEDGIINAIDPGDNMLFEVTNQSGSTGDVMLAANWVEIPASEYP